MDDLISRQAAIMDAESWVAADEYEKNLQKKVIEWLKEFPPAQPEPCEDAVSRKAAIDAILGQPPEPHYPSWYAEQIKQLPPAQPEQNLDEWCYSCKEYDKEKHSCPRWNKVIKNTVDELKSAQSEPCEDAVNRETLLKFFDGWMSALDENCHNQSVSDLKIIKRDFANLPPVTPKQRTGKWIPQDHNKRVGNISTCVYYYPICSKCGKVGIETYKYCPHCGADMREETT